MRRSLIGRDPRIADRCRVIYNGVGLPAATMEPGRSPARASLNLQPEDLVVSAVANFRHYKGHRDVLDAYATLRRTSPRARLLLAGGGPEEANLNRHRNDPGRLRYRAPRVSPGRLSQLDPAGDGHGPPRRSDTGGGVPEQVVEGTTGLLVEPGDTAALAMALGRLASDARLRLEMGAAGRARAAESFSWERMIASYSNLYTEIAATSLNRGPVVDEALKPQLEHAKRPQAVGVVGAAAGVLVQQALHAAGLEPTSPCQRRAQEGVSQQRQQLTAEPCVDRNAEAHLPASEDAFGQEIADGSTKDDLAGATPQLHRCRKPGDELGEILVQERGPHLEAVSHRSDVDLNEKVIGEIGLDLDE